MSKQIMIADRPGDSAVKQSIGNYKGVMLCNRPNDPSDKPQREGPTPFISRVTVKEQLGLNPATKQAQVLVRPKKTLEILNRHKQWLFQLQKQKDDNLQKELERTKIQEVKIQKMKKKYSTSKKPEESSDPSKESPDQIKEPSKPSKSEKLTEKNLKTLEKEAKPKWALTQEQAEELEELEVDDLLQYVNDLDYDKFIEDLEVRQALEIVKERVEEIKKDKEWKTKIAEKFNEDEKSVNSRGSMKSYESKARSQISRNEKAQDWDRSVS
jgi:myosin heavy subunit